MASAVYRVGALGRGLIGLSSRSCVAHVCACVCVCMCECEFERECECACQETGLKLECLDGYLSPPQLLDLLSLSLILLVRITPPVPLATCYCQRCSQSRSVRFSRFVPLPLFHCA